MSETEAPLISVAVIFPTNTPTSEFGGVPVNVLVSALNVSHDGIAVPSSIVAVYVSLSPTS